MAQGYLKIIGENHKTLRYHHIEPIVLQNPLWFDFYFE
jgi:hypothetical protein